jgi:hypothetical protein
MSTMKELFVWSVPAIFILALVSRRALRAYRIWLLQPGPISSYMSWLLRQLYLLICWPTQFHREFDDAYKKSDRPSYRSCLVYFVKLLPWIVGLAILGNLLAGHAFQGLTESPQRVSFQWSNAWMGVGLGVLLGVLLGVAISVVLDVALGVTVAVALGIAFGVTAGVPVGLPYGVKLDATFGQAFGMTLGVTLGVALGITVSATEGMPAGLAAGIGGFPVGLAVGVAAGIPSGLDVGLRSGLAAGVAFPLTFLVVYFRLPSYPLEVMLASLTYFVGRWQPGLVRRAWHWSPVAWNEVIWLPLPFVGNLLALLVHQDRDRGFRAIAFVAAQRPRQRRVATAALIEVALDDLRCQAVEDLAKVTEKLRWTTAAPMQLPPDLAATLPGFDRASQDAGQYLTLNSPYRRQEALGRALDDIKALQRSLIATRGPAAPLLLQAANDWHGVLETEWGLFHDRVKAIHGIPNPFVLGNPVTERQANVFAGRQDIVEQVEECVLGARQAPTILLHGPRRMGKTSILKQLPRLLGPDFAPALVDCQNPAVLSSQATLLRYLSREISAGLRLRRVLVDPLASEALTREPYTVFDDWLDNVEVAMPLKQRILLCLDEYENLQRILDAGWGEEFLDALRHTLQHRAKIVLMFTGAHTFAEQGPAWTNRFLSAQRVRVSFLTKQEIVPLLTRPIPEFDLTYAEGSLDAIYCATHGQPFLTQVVAFHLVETLNKQERKTAQPADVEAAVNLALVRNSEYFDSVWFDAGLEGQAVLTALALAQPPPVFPRAESWLREHDVLNEDGGFAVPMVERWVRKKAT